MKNTEQLTEEIEYLISEKKYAQAEIQLNSLLTLHPNSIEIMNVIATIQYQRGKYFDLLRTLMAIKKINPADNQSTEMLQMLTERDQEMQNNHKIVVEKHYVSGVSRDGIRCIAKREELPALLNELHLTESGLEVGVQAGIFSEQILNQWNGKKLYLVDIWRQQADYADVANVDNDKQLELFLAVCKKFFYDNRVTVIREDSVAAANHFRDEFFDFVYLDADHSYEGVVNDIEAWYPKLKKGGVLAGHDYLFGEVLPEGHDTLKGADISIYFGVQSAVDEFVIKNNLELFVTNDMGTKPNNSPTWYVIKK